MSGTCYPDGRLDLKQTILHIFEMCTSVEMNNQVCEICFSEIPSLNSQGYE